MQSKLFRASLAGPSDRSGVATRIIAKIFSGTDLIPRHHDSSLEASRSIRSVHTLITSGRFRSSSEIEPAIDTHSYRHTPDRLVQPIFRPPSRRPPPECSPSISRRDAGLKMLCIMQDESWARLILFCFWEFPFGRQQSGSRNPRPPNAPAFWRRYSA